MAVDRRRVLLAFGCSSVGLPPVLGAPAHGIPDLRGDHMTTSLDLPGRLDSLDETVQALIAGYERASITASAVRVRQELAAGLSLMQDSQATGPLRTRIHRCVGRLSALLAATHSDLDDPGGAVDAFAVAFDHATAAGDRSLQGWIRVWQATLARAGGDPRTGSALARDAARLAGRRSPVAARAAVVEGHCEGMLGDRWAVHDRVGLAWRIVGDLSDDELGEPGFAVDQLHTATLAEMSASVYNDLGWADLAAGYVDVSLSELDGTGATGLRSLIRIVAGASAVCEGDVERGVAWVNEALDFSAARPSGLLTARGVQFVSQARRAAGGHTALDDLDERLRFLSVSLA
jgi:hypothetical protein